MTLNYFKDHMFDLLNESELLDVHDIETIENGYRITVKDGSLFQVLISETTPRNNILQLFPEREE